MWASDFDVVSKYIYTQKVSQHVLRVFTRVFLGV